MAYDLTPGPNEFSAEEEQAMRASTRAANTMTADATPPARPPAPAEDDAAARQIMQDNKFRNLLHYYVGKKAS